MALGDSQMVGIPKKPVPGDAHQRSPSHDPASWKFQLLACPEVRALDEHVLQLAPRYLRSECSQMQWLMLNALITTCDEPSKAKSMWILQESLLELLQDLDDEVVETNLSLLKMMLQAANSPVCSTLVLELTGRLQPLFHHTTSSVQLLSLELFQRLMQSVNKKERQPMKTRVYENVIELLCLLHAESPEVAEASRVTLLGAAAFLKKRRLRKLPEKRKTLEVGKYLLSGCGSRAAHYVQQAARCLWSHQQPIREAAVRFLGETQPLSLPAPLQLGPSPGCGAAAGISRVAAEPRVPGAGPWRPRGSLRPVPALPCAWRSLARGRAWAQPCQGEGGVWPGCRDL
ncbi:uncharacterized protein LOC133626635 [Colius striatus]|uniref:uncharacterized protein LOC133626635 n=1 Tax=Colius striatus TaxID=57412 RepID=UPI002B1D35FF|nr:uncharacterized protein LOC133626635 [Colius striatus]